LAKLVKGNFLLDSCVNNIILNIENIIFLCTFILLFVIVLR